VEGEKVVTGAGEAASFLGERASFLRETGQLTAGSWR
jgi:hypothetical protein